MQMLLKEHNSYLSRGFDTHAAIHVMESPPLYSIEMISLNAPIRLHKRVQARCA